MVSGLWLVTKTNCLPHRYRWNFWLHRPTLRLLSVDSNCSFLDGSVVFIQPWRGEYSAYSERANIFFDASKIENDERRVTLFLNAIGAKTYSLIRDLLSPETLITKTFKQLKARVIGYCWIILLLPMKPKASESVQEYLAELRKLAQHCAFGEFCNDALRDHFVCVLHSQAALKCLLAETVIKTR